MTPVEIIHEFRRKYEKTYIFVKDPSSDNESLFFVDQIEDTADRPAVIHLTSEEVGKIRLNFGSAHTIRFALPPVGVFQHNNRAIIGLRVPAKQYRRGVCKDNMAFGATTQRIYNQRVTFDFNLVAAAFKGEKYSFKDALGLLSKGKYQSVALHDNFSLSLSHDTTNNHLLLFWDFPVARITPSGEIANIMETVLSPQITAVLNK